LVETLLSSLTPLRLAGRELDADRALDRARSLRPDDARVAAAEVLLAVEALAKEGTGVIGDISLTAWIQWRQANQFWCGGCGST
jgi:hypothetical protein